MTCKDKGYNIFCINYEDAADPPPVVPAPYPGDADTNEDYCLYVDETKGEVTWYSKMAVDGTFDATGRTFKTGIVTKNTGWHFFAVIYKSFDTAHPELVRSDF